MLCLSRWCIETEGGSTRQATSHDSRQQTGEHDSIIFFGHFLRVLPDHPMLLTGGSVVARRHIQGLDKVRDLKPKLVWRGFLGEASAHADKISARSDRLVIE